MLQGSGAYVYKIAPICKRQRLNIANSQSSDVEKNKSSMLSVQLNTSGKNVHYKLSSLSVTKITPRLRQQRLRTLHLTVESLRRLTVVRAPPPQPFDDRTPSVRREVVCGERRRSRVAA